MRKEQLTGPQAVKVKLLPEPIERLKPISISQTAEI